MSIVRKSKTVIYKKRERKKGAESVELPTS
jgi:hypothetical protein